MAPPARGGRAVGRGREVSVTGARGARGRGRGAFCRSSKRRGTRALRATLQELRVLSSSGDFEPAGWSQSTEVGLKSRGPVEASARGRVSQSA